MKNIKSFFHIIIYFVLINNTFSQYKNTKTFSAGLNLYTSLNKITIGINTMYINKNSIYFYLNGNIGLTGFKQFDELIYEKTDSFKVGNSNVYSYAYNITNSYVTPYDEKGPINIPPNSNGFLNNYNAKIWGSFVNLSIGFPINNKKTIYTGTNTSFFWNTDRGDYTYTAIYPATQRITNNIYAKFKTVGLGFFFSYFYQISKRIIILPQLNFNFYFPITNANYGVSDASNPLVGAEQDLSISINYKF